MSDDYCPWGEDESDFAHKTTPVARKLHHCDECGGEIPPGMKHERMVFFYSGHADTFRTCRPCLDGPVAFILRNCPYHIYADVRRHLEETVFGEYPDFKPGKKFMVGRMIVEMKRRGRSARSKLVAA